MLRVDGIDVFYGDLQALRGVSFEVVEGEVVSVIGSNGAGKSTTLKTVSGILRPRKGTIEFEDEDICRASTTRIVEMGISHIPEGRQLFPTMTVEENLEMGAQFPRMKKVAIGRGLMSKPRLMMFDEPSLGLAPLLVTTIFEIIRQINEQNTAILLIEQNVFHALTISDRGYVLENGEIALSGDGKWLMENPHIRKTYLGL